MTEPIDPPPAQARFDEPWSHRTVAVLSDDDIRVVKTKGEFTRHRLLETDAVFLVLGGSLTIGLDDVEVILGPGSCTSCRGECTTSRCQSRARTVVLIEPSTTVNTGDTPSHLTAERRLD